MKQRLILRSSERCVYFIEEGNISFYLIIPNCKNVTLVIKLDNITEMEVSKIKMLPNHVIIIPNFSKTFWNDFALRQNIYYQALDVVLSQILNFSYKILVNNQIQVGNVVYLNLPSTYLNFGNWFCQKYLGRVKLFSLGDGEVKLDKLKPKLGNELGNERGQVRNNLESRDKGELGFVSYVLLGVVVAILSLVFLYFII